MTYTRKNKGVCSRQTTVTLSPDGIIESVAVEGGCNGNLQGIATLLAGQPAQDAIARLEGIRCDKKASSCPDQIALCLKEALALI